MAFAGKDSPDIWGEVVAGDIVDITTPGVHGRSRETKRVEVRMVIRRTAGELHGVVLVDIDHRAWPEHRDSEITFVERAGAREIAALDLDPRWLLSRRYEGTEHEVLDFVHLDRPVPAYALRWVAGAVCVEVGDSASLSGATFTLISGHLGWNTGNPSAIPAEDHAAVTTVAVAEYQREAMML